ncbi:hypothetical protein CH637_000105 [Haemophilus influenzae]|nr:hypothetical protein [Haemophilus influenzae]
MKKTLVAALISSVILLTGCQDKDTEAKIKQLNQTVAQLSAENTKLKEQIEKQFQQLLWKMMKYLINLKLLNILNRKKITSLKKPKLSIQFQQ